MLPGLLVAKGEYQILSRWCLPYLCSRCGSVCLLQDWVEGDGEHCCARDPPKQFHLHTSADCGFLLGFRLGGFCPGKMRPTLSCAKQYGASLLTFSKFIPQKPAYMQCICWRHSNTVPFFHLPVCRVTHSKSVG